MRKPKKRYVGERIQGTFGFLNGEWGYVPAPGPRKVELDFGYCKITYEEPGPKIPKEPETIEIKPQK